MSAELIAKIIMDAPLLGVLLLVLWKGGDKADSLGKKMDKQTDATNKQTLAINSLAAKVELIGKIQDVRLELHEERTGKHQAVTSKGATTVLTANGAAPSTRRPPHPSWPDDHDSEDES